MVFENRRTRSVTIKFWGGIKDIRNILYNMMSYYLFYDFFYLGLQTTSVRSKCHTRKGINSKIAPGGSNTLVKYILQIAVHFAPITLGFTLTFFKKAFRNVCNVI